MVSKFIVNSIGIGGSFFVGLIIFWFIFVYLKKRLTSDQPHQSMSVVTNSSWEEKRRHPRLDISWKALIQHPDASQEVQLKDISLGGSFVICQEPLALQDRFKIIITLPESQKLQLNAEVVWSNINMPDDRVVNRGMGIKFIGNKPDERQQLQDAIDAADENSSETV